MHYLLYVSKFHSGYGFGCYGSKNLSPLRSLQSHYLFHTHTHPIVGPVPLLCLGTLVSHFNVYLPHFISGTHWRWRLTVRPEAKVHKRRVVCHKNALKMLFITGRRCVSATASSDTRSPGSSLIRSTFYLFNMTVFYRYKFVWRRLWPILRQYLSTLLEGTEDKHEIRLNEQ
jgi:hypothetical protein